MPGWGCFFQQVTYLHICTVSKQHKWIKVKLWSRGISKYSGLKTFLFEMTRSSCQTCGLPKENKSVNDFQNCKSAKHMSANDWNLVCCCESKLWETLAVDSYARFNSFAWSCPLGKCVSLILQYLKCILNCPITVIPLIRGHHSNSRNSFHR